MSIKRLGKFGEFVKQYEKARKAYPEAINFLKSLTKNKNPLILDLGCGTGISTRQLTKIGTVIGVDPDPKMLQAARRHKNSGIKKYVLARADKLPFKDETFDVIAAFSSFHWFGDKKSVSEIKRVLKPSGIFFVGSHMGSISWGRYRTAIIKSINQEVAQFKSVKFNPKKILIAAEFKKVKVRLWKKRELYNLKNAIEYVQSVSIWQSVPKSLRSKALKGVEEYFKNIRNKQGKIERKLVVKAVAGIK